MKPKRGHRPDDWHDSEANIITSEKENASMIPSTAVKGRAVIVIKDDKAVRMPVETGIQTQDSNRNHLGRG